MFYKFSKGEAIYSVPNGLGDGSAYFDGNSGARLDSNLSLPYGSNPRSVSLWVYYIGTSGNTSGWQYLIAWGVFATSQLYVVALTGNKLALGCFNSNYESSIEVTKNTWHHMVYTYDGNNNHQIYLDGQPKASFTLNTLNTQKGEITLGYNSQYGEYFNGNLKDINIYNRVLSVDEVTQLYNKQEITDGRVLNVPLQYGQDDDSMFSLKNFVYDYSLIGTSSGFNSLGNPIRYRSASQAGVAFSTFINQSTVFALDSNKGDTELINNLTPTYSNGTCLSNSTFSFDGDSKYATYPTQGVADVNLGTGAFTIEWDCKIGTDHYGTYPSFICMGNSWSTAGCYIVQWQRSYSGGISSHWNGSFDADCYPTTTFPQFNGDGLYHHIAITRDDSGLYCFWVDGKQLADTYTRTLPLDLSYTDLYFGYNRIDGGRLQYDMKHFRISKECLYSKDFNIPKWVGA